MLNTKRNERKTINMIVPIFLIGIILVGSGCVMIPHFAYAKKKSSTGDTGGGGTTTGGTGGGTTTGGPQHQPNVKVGQINQQNCAGIQSVFECNLNVNNIHKTTIREGGSTVVVGQPATTASGATPVILYVQGVGYVEVTGVQAAGSGQATITYVVLVPAK
jgi:hypothetical protein